MRSPLAIEWKAAYAHLQKSGEVEFAPACLHYLLQVLRSAPPPIDGKNLSPQELTRHFRRQSKMDFGPLLPMVLIDWGMSGPSEFARGMIALGREGCVNLDASDTLESFLGDDSRSFLDA